MSLCSDKSDYVFFFFLQIEEVENELAKYNSKLTSVEQALAKKREPDERYNLHVNVWGGACSTILSLLLQ